MLYIYMYHELQFVCPLQPFLGDIPSPVTGYSLSYFGVNVGVPACQEHEVECERMVDVDTFSCPPSDEIGVTLSASYMLGQGPTTDPTNIGNFVSVCSQKRGHYGLSIIFPSFLQRFKAYLYPIVTLLLCAI